MAMNSGAFCFGQIRKALARTRMPMMARRGEALNRGIDS